MKITEHLKVEEALSKKLWLMYNDTYAKLRTTAPCRQYLQEVEFFEEMKDQSMIKFILWDENDEPVGLSIVATNISAVPWISPEYYANRYPDHYRKGKIYYFCAILITESTQKKHYSNFLLGHTENFVISNDGIACFDCADINNTFLPQLIKITTEQQGYVDCEKLGQQHYYAYVAKGFKSDFGNN